MNRSLFDPHDRVRSICTQRMVPVICLILMIASGCRDPVGGPVNLNTAQKILSSAMQSWKDGKTPKDLQQAKPSVFVQELEWNNGVTLVDYEILSNDQPVGPNLIATVKLKLSNAEGNVSEKTATYVVSTSPSLTIYRNTMR